MSDNIENLLSTSLSKAQNKIKKVLQEFHNETGLIPISVEFYAYNEEVVKYGLTSTMKIKCTIQNVYIKFEIPYL